MLRGYQTKLYSISVSTVNNDHLFQTCMIYFLSTVSIHFHYMGKKRWEWMWLRLSFHGKWEKRIIQVWNNIMMRTFLHVDTCNSNLSISAYKIRRHFYEIDLHIFLFHTGKTSSTDSFSQNVFIHISSNCIQWVLKYF